MWKRIAFLAIVVGVSLHVGVLSAGPPTFKNTFQINGQLYKVDRYESTNGRIRSIRAVGTSTVPTGQQLKRVDILWNYAGRPLGQAQGVVESQTKWNASIGDFQLDSYQFRFQVKKGTQLLYYTSPIYVYGRP